MEYAIQLLVCILMFLFGGMWLDDKFHTAPWWGLAGLILGIVIGFAMMYKRLVYGQPVTPHQSSRTRSNSSRNTAKTFKHEDWDDPESWDHEDH